MYMNRLMIITLSKEIKNKWLKSFYAMKCLLNYCVAKTLRSTPDVLDEMGLSYDPAWIAKCVDQEKRNETAVWDEEGNLLT